MPTRDDGTSEPDIGHFVARVKRKAHRAEEARTFDERLPGRLSKLPELQTNPFEPPRPTQTTAL